MFQKLGFSRWSPENGDEPPERTTHLYDEQETREVQIYEPADGVRANTADGKRGSGMMGPLSQNLLRGHRRWSFLWTVLWVLTVAGIIISSTHYASVTRRLQQEVTQLKVRTKECGDGWMRFGCSCYFTSSEGKTWSDGRRACERRGSDLVVISSREEQDFVSGLMKPAEFWIGLRTTENKTGFKWETVDESPLTETFWTGLSVQPSGLYVAACCDQQGKFTQSRRDGNDVKRFVCEK